MTDGSWDVVDIHPHVVAADHDRYPLRPIGGTVSGWAAERPVSDAELLGAMDAAGIAQAAVVQSSTAHGYDNSYLLDAVARAPDRLVAVACVDPLAPEARSTVEELAGSGVAGLRLFTAGSTMAQQSSWLADDTTRPVWEAASEADLPVCIQMRSDALPQLDRLLARFPDVPVVLDHMAYPDLTAGPRHEPARPLLELARHPGLYLKATMRVFEPLRGAPGGPGAFLRQVVDSFGVDRIAWGSNFPAAPQNLKDLLALALESFSDLAVDERQWVLSGTARRLYPALGHDTTPSDREGA